MTVPLAFRAAAVYGSTERTAPDGGAGRRPYGHCMTTQPSSGGTALLAVVALATVFIVILECVFIALPSCWLLAGVLLMLISVAIGVVSAVVILSTTTASNWPTAAGRAEAAGARGPTPPRPAARSSDTDWQATAGAARPSKRAGRSAAGAGPRRRTARCQEAGAQGPEREPQRSGQGPRSWLVNVARVLLVEDDRDIAEPLARALGREGYDVSGAADGPTALTSVLDDPPDLIVLDVGLPGMTGMDVCRAVRDLQPDLPILMLTARDGELDAVAGLDAGADDYVTKLFRLAELLARIRRMLRRSAPPRTRPAACASTAPPAARGVTSASSSSHRRSSSCSPCWSARPGGS